MTMSLFGRVAAAVFAGWYFFRLAGTLKNFQAAAACVRIMCGVDIGAMPLVAANLIKGAAAVSSSFRRSSGWKGKGLREQWLAMWKVRP
jgi:hypothetical protein